MGIAMKKDFTMDELEVKYNLITGLYDLSDELVSTVESPLVQNQEDQLAIVEPLINDISDATDVLAEEFLLIADARRGRNGKSFNKARVESSLRKIFNALNDYQERVKDTTKKAHGAILNIADSIVAKIQRDIEEIVVVFLELVNLSLASIMHKQQLETVKARDPRIALMMHQHAMNMQQ